MSIWGFYWIANGPVYSNFLGALPRTQWVRLIGKFFCVFWCEGARRIGSIGRRNSTKRLTKNLTDDDR